MKTTNSYSSYKKNLKRAIIKNTISNVKSEIPEAFTAVPVLVFTYPRRKAPSFRAVI